MRNKSYRWGPLKISSSDGEKSLLLQTLRRSLKRSGDRRKKKQTRNMFTMKGEGGVPLLFPLLCNQSFKACSLKRPSVGFNCLYLFMVMSDGQDTKPLPKAQLPSDGLLGNYWIIRALISPVQDQSLCRDKIRGHFEVWKLGSESWWEESAHFIGRTLN